MIYKATGSLRAIQVLLGHAKIENTPIVSGSAPAVVVRETDPEGWKAAIPLDVAARLQAGRSESIPMVLFVARVTAKLLDGYPLRAHAHGSTRSLCCSLVRKPLSMPID